MSKEYTYDIDKYTIGVDENGEDEIGMTVVKIENGEIYFLGNCYSENARCIDLLIKENQKLKKQLEEYKNNYFKLSEENDKYSIKLHKYKTQQKKFIKYLEDEIGACELVCDCIFNHNKEMKVYKEVLQKYKEIIGVSDDNKTTI